MVLGRLSSRNRPNSSRMTTVSRRSSADVAKKNKIQAKPLHKGQVENKTNPMAGSAECVKTRDPNGTNKRGPTSDVKTAKCKATKAKPKHNILARIERSMGRVMAIDKEPPPAPLTDSTTDVRVTMSHGEKPRQQRPLDTKIDCPTNPKREVQSGFAVSNMGREHPVSNCAPNQMGSFQSVWEQNLYYWWYMSNCWHYYGYVPNFGPALTSTNQHILESAYREQETLNQFLLPPPPPPSHSFPPPPPEEEEERKPIDERIMEILGATC